MLVFGVTGAPKPLLAVIGTAGSPPAAMGFPQGLTLEVPGAGELSTRQVAALPGPGQQVALSNVVGAWAEHYAITDLDHLVPLVDRNDGLRVQLPDPVTIGDEVLGPGAVTMTGAQVAEFLGAEGQNTYTRWEIVLTAFLATPPTIEASDLTETDDLAGVQATFDGAEGGRLETLPVKVAAATIRVPDYEQVDTLMADRFGVKRTPVPVIVQNAAGSGRDRRGGRAAVDPPRVPRDALAERGGVRRQAHADHRAGRGSPERGASRARRVGCGPHRRVPGSIGDRRRADRGREGLHGLTGSEGAATERADRGVPTGREMAITAARAAAAKQATDIVVLDVHEVIVITDVFVICTASTQRQVKTVIEAVEDALRELGEKPVRREGEPEGGWWLLDYIDLVVHVFGEEERDYYDLERLWKDAPRVEWQEPEAASSG